MTKPVCNSKRSATMMTMDDNSLSFEACKSVCRRWPLSHRHQNRVVNLRNCVFALLATIHKRDRMTIIISATLQPTMDGLDIYFNVGHGSSIYAILKIGSSHVGQPVLRLTIFEQPVLRLTGCKNHFNAVCGGLSPHFSSKKSASAILPGNCALGGVVKSTTAQSGNLGICLALLR